MEGGTEPRTSPEGEPSEAGVRAQAWMARGGIEPPTPRFSVKELEAVVWPWLQGLSLAVPSGVAGGFPRIPVDLGHQDDLMTGSR